MFPDVPLDVPSRYIGPTPAEWRLLKRILRLASTLAKVSTCQRPGMTRAPPEALPQVSPARAGRYGRGQLAADPRTREAPRSRASRRAQGAYAHRPRTQSGSLCAPA